MSQRKYLFALEKFLYCILHQELLQFFSFENVLKHFLQDDTFDEIAAAILVTVFQNSSAASHKFWGS